MLAPLNINVPVPFFVNAPEPVVIVPLINKFPIPETVSVLFVPVIALVAVSFKVSVLIPSACICEAPDNVTNPEIVFLPLILLMAPLPPPVPVMVIASPILIPPCICRAAPDATVVAPAVVPKAVAF